MKIKTVISLLTFGLTFGLSAYFASFFLPEKVVVKDKAYNFNYNYDYKYNFDFDQNKSDSAILKFLRQDIENGDDRSVSYSNRSEENNAESKFKNYIARESEAVKTYHEASASMDSSNLPQDFRVAWKKHMNAWRNYSNFLVKSAHAESVDRDEFYAKSAELDDEISSTWQDVLDIGDNYDERVAFEIQ